MPKDNFDDLAKARKNGVSTPLFRGGGKAVKSERPSEPDPGVYQKTIPMHYDSANPDGTRKTWTKRYDPRHLEERRVLRTAEEIEDERKIEDWTEYWRRHE